MEIISSISIIKSGRISSAQFTLTLFPSTNSFERCREIWKIDAINVSNLNEDTIAVV